MKTVKLHNTLTGKTENFEPKNSTIKIYVCGPTVYNFIHIGNARPYVFFDVVRKYLEYLNYEVIYVQNFTDIDDKIIKIAHKENVSIEEISEKYIEEYFLDAEALNIKKANFHPRVTEHIEEIIKIISNLLEKEMAYKARDGIYFKVDKFNSYGKLSKQDLSSIENKDDKDFALWKFEENQNLSWSAPFGQGRPGWHIECSAMINKNLGNEIDIHGGGQDLIFPHHENEIAQSESVNNKPLAKYWMHNAFVIFENTKMSKSLGNTVLIRELLEKYNGNIIRLSLLMTHYRKPINFSYEKLEMYKSSYQRIENFFLRIENIKENQEGLDLSEISEKLVRDFEKEMNEDFNTPGALGIIFEALKQVNTILDQTKISTSSLKVFFEKMNLLLKILGIEILNNRDENKLTSSLITLLVKMREDARLEKNWFLADKIRDELLKIGIILEDTKEGTEWKIY